MPKLKEEKEQEDGWTRWVPPLMIGYKMACCDCGLVHNMEFKAVKITAKNDDDTWEYKELDIDKFRIIMRAKRNNRSTGQTRRQKHEKDI
uniref:Uncharacterized protein n=1 Tax=viral metagenome TaxID=1070528 RepID=A0A6M3LFE8_9ZZZZ